MKAVIVTQTGDPEVLQLIETAKPLFNPSEVLIKVYASGVNRADILMRQGRYGTSKQAPSAPLGLEVAGVVVEIGSEVSRWKRGDKICALLKNGGYAAYAAADARHCFPIPDSFSFEEAACLPETLMTVWSNVFQRMHLQRGENFLVHGGTSGIGTTAIQLAKAFGVRPFATAGTDEKCYFCEQLGAIKCINYKTQDFLEVLEPEGMDVILDYIGGDYTPKNLRLLKPDGRLGFLASLGGAQSQFNILEVMTKRLTITGSTLAPRDADFKASLAAEVEKHIWPLLENQQFKPILFRSFDLGDAAEAHKLMQSSQHIGKIVLTVGH